MKSIIIILITLGISLPLISQSTSDQKSLFDKVLTLVEFQKHAYPNSYVELELIILDTFGVLRQIKQSAITDKPFLMLITHKQKSNNRKLLFSIKDI